jgi:hypothetical protein
MQTLAAAPPKASNEQLLQQTEWICKTDTEDDVNATHADTTVQEPRIK